MCKKHPDMSNMESECMLGVSLLTIFLSEVLMLERPPLHED